MAVPWAWMEAEVVAKCFCETNLPHGWENRALSGWWKRNSKSEDIALAPRIPSSRKSLHTASVALTHHPASGTNAHRISHPRDNFMLTSIHSFKSIFDGLIMTLDHDKLSCSSMISLSLYLPIDIFGNLLLVLRPPYLFCCLLCSPPLRGLSSWVLCFLLPDIKK